MPDFAVVTAFRATDKMSPVFNKMGNNVERFGRRANMSFGTVAKGILAATGIGFGLGVVKNALFGIVDAARMVEDARATFTPLMGGAEKAGQLVDRLNQFAADTPFQFQNIAKVTQQLLPVMNKDINKTISTLQMLGDTAGGNAEKLGSITRGFTKAMLKGKVDMESLNMIAEAGIPIYPELAKNMGFAENQMTQFFKKISTGTVSTNELVKVFKNMTSKGGMFFQGMIIASKTTSGVISTMKDNVTLFAAELGTQLLPYIKEFAIGISESMKSTIVWMKGNRDIIKGFVSAFARIAGYIPTVVKGFLAYRAVLISIFVWQKAVIAIGWIRYLVQMGPLMAVAIKAQGLWAFMLKGTALWTGILAAKQWLLNVAMAANPVGIIIVGMAAMVGLIILLIKYWDQWGATFSVFLGPVGMLVSYFKTLYDQWEAIKMSFTTGGIIAGLKAIGLALFDAMIAPFKQLWGMIKSVTGIGSAEAPNKAEVAARNQTTNVNIRNRNVETEAEVTPQRGATINYATMGAN